MIQPQEKSALHWLLPSMARDGLVKNGDWVLPAAAEAAALFSDPDLILPAQFLAVLDRFALDYIRQAPVLVVAATHGARLVHRNDRLTTGRRFIAECTTGPKLPALLKSFGLAAQTRALSGLALGHGQRDLLVALSEMVPSSTLAQIIPKTGEEQLVWLQSLERWRIHVGRMFRSKNLFLDWAAIHVRDAGARGRATDVADFAGRTRDTFNLDWTFEQALAASERWHQQLAFRPVISEANRPDWRMVIDYAPLPSELELDGFVFRALQTREALFEEGARMHHCVRLYSDKVVQGSSRIYSVHRDGQPIATLELVRASRSRAGVCRFRLGQLRGPRNTRAEEAVARATAAFVSAVNRIVSNGARDIAPERGERAIEELRVRVGDEVCEAWFGRLEFGEFDGKVLKVSLPSKFLTNWARKHYGDVLLNSCAVEFDGVQAVEIGQRMTPPGAAVRVERHALGMR